jgi:hypothetical protein
MSYAYAVTLLETFLGDTFKALIIKRENFLENAIKNVKEIKNEKYSIFELSKTRCYFADFRNIKLQFYT